MAYTTEMVAAIMSMKPETIVSIVDVADGTLVTTREGAQTLIADGRCSPVYPRRDVPLNLPGRGSEELRASVLGDLITELRQPLPVADGTEREAEGTGVPMEPVEAIPDGTEHELTVEGEPMPDEVPDGTAEVVMAWVGEDKTRAEQALDAELKRQTPRTTLVSKLSNLLAKLGYQS